MFSLFKLFLNIHLSCILLFIWDFLSFKDKNVIIKSIQIKIFLSVRAINYKTHGNKNFWATQKILIHILNFAFFSF